MLELINIIVNRDDFYGLGLIFNYYTILSERRYYIHFISKGLMIEKDRIGVIHKNIKKIIKYA